MKIIDLPQFMNFLGYEDYAHRLEFSYQGKQEADGSYIVDTDKIKGIWLKDECDIDNSGIRAKPLDDSLFNSLADYEQKAFSNFEKNIRLDLPCTPLEFLKWAKRNRFTDLFPSDDIDAYKKAIADGRGEAYRVGFNYGLTKTFIRRNSGDGVFNVDWQHWLGLPNWTPEQAVCLFYGIDSDVLGNHQCRDIFVKLTRKVELKGNMTPYQWQQFGIEQKLPLPNQLMKIHEPQFEPVADVGRACQDDTDPASTKVIQAGTVENCVF